MITLACFWEYVPYCFRNLIIWSFLGLRQACSIESASPTSLWPLCSCQLVADVYRGRHSVFVLGAFAKLRKGIISSVMSVRPSARPLGTARLPLDRFSWNLISEYFSKICREISIAWRPVYIYDIAQFDLEWETFQTKVVEKFKTHVLCSITVFFSKVVLFVR